MYTKSFFRLTTPAYSKQLLLLAGLTLPSFVLQKTYAQKERNQTSKSSFSGYVEDAGSGERLIGAVVQVDALKQTTSTNTYGFFSMPVTANGIRLMVSYLGYISMDTTITVDGTEPVVLKLATRKDELKEVIITSSSKKTIQEEVQMSKVSLTAAQIQSLPKFFGEADVLKALQLMPGVQQGSEGTSALLVRGGSPDQNLILLDGAPIYNPSHLLGIFSTFNVSTIKNVDLYKGAFPSRFGGRVSSVVDIATKDGNQQKIHGDFSIGLLASQLTLEGPIVKNKTTFLISGRRTYGDILMKPLVKSFSESQVSPVLYFYDFNVKVAHRFSEKDKLYLSLYGGKDEFGAKMNLNDAEQGETSISWGNYLGTLRWNHVFSNKLFSNITLMATDFGLNIGSEFSRTSNGQTSEEKISLNSGIRDVGGKVDFDYFPHQNHKVKFGAGLVHHKFTPGSTRFTSKENDTVVASLENKEFNTENAELDVYVEDDWKITDKLSANVGLHWSALIGKNTTYNQLQPRISARYILPGEVGLKLSYARMAQYMHLLSGNTITLPTDLWVPVTDRIKPQLADQVALGLARGVWNNKVELSVEGYYKKLDNIIEYRDGASYVVSSSNISWEDKITSGKGTAYGIEFMAQKKEGRLTGWLAYTWSKTERTLPEVNFGRTFPYKYDRRHDLKAVATYKLTKGIEATGCFIFQSAMPFTMAYSKYEEANEHLGDPIEDVKNITARNNVRIEPYHRLDLGINFIKEKKNGIVRTWNVSVYNVYNRQNPFYYYQSTNSAGNERIMRLSLLPILPSISYSLKF